MIDVLDHRIKTKNGIFVPVFLFGTYKTDQAAMQLAFNHGFRAFDLAAIYKSEDLILDGLRQYAHENALVLDRKQFYFCYKLDASRLSGGQVIEQANQFVAKLKTLFHSDDAYIDMLLIHYPNHEVPIEETWNAMNQLVLSKKVLEIGVSNFSLSHLKYMEKAGLNLPAINQIEVNPFIIQKELVDYCSTKHIVISSYRSARHKDDEFDRREIESIAEALWLTPIQVINSWKFSKGFQVVGISSNAQHIQALKYVKNLEKTYMDRLDRLDKGELGRTCVGSWSRFDFQGDVWGDYQKAYDRSTEVNL